MLSTPIKGTVSTITPATRDRIFGEASACAPLLLAIFKSKSLQITYLNARGRTWIDSAHESDFSKYTLHDIIGVSSLQRWGSEILPNLMLTGRWDGNFEIRDAWGSERDAMVTISAHKDPERPSERYVCLQAMPFDNPFNEEASVGDRELLHALLENSTDCIYFKDKHSRLLRVSRSMAEKFKKTDPKELVGRTDFDFFTTEHALPAYEDEQRIMKTGEPIINFEEKETWADGQISWVSTTKIALRDQAGETVGTFGISRDITARKHTELQAKELEAQLQLAHKLESIGRLAAGVAHEINTPSQFIADNTRFLVDAFDQIGDVLASYQNLLAKAGECESCQEAVTAARDTESRNELPYLLDEIPQTLEQTLSGLSQVSRIVSSLKEFSHPGNAERSRADLNRAIENALVVTRHSWKTVAEVATEFDPELPAVPCIVDEFNQVMLNLIVNAAQSIEAANADDKSPKLGSITVRTRSDGQSAIIEVQDSGTGMPKEVKERIFEPFFTTKGVGDGTGQGLSFVHTIVVSRHHGSIEVDSEPGQGATFRILLPLTKRD